MFCRSALGRFSAKESTKSFFGDHCKREGGRGLQLTTVFLLMTEKLKPKRIHMIVEFLGIHGFTVQTKHLTVTVPP